MYVPSNLDFVDLSEQYPLTNLPAGKHSKDYLYYFCHQLVQIRSMYGGEHPIYGSYFPICTAMLRTLHFNYNSFMNYLIQAQVIQSDGQFIVGQKCKGYKFTQTYSGQIIKPLVVENHVLSRNIQKQKQKLESEAKELLKEYAHLTKWYLCGGLEIDQPSALAWVERYKRYKLQELNAGSLSGLALEEKSNKVIDTCEGWKLFIDKIDRKELNYSDFTVDDFAGRFHGVLTFLKKELRAFLKFRGQKLVSVDIKNCQPYLTTVLLTPEFWTPKERSGNSIVKLQDINPAMYADLSIHPIYSTITLLLFDSPGKGFSMQKYKELVINGDFYEFLQKELPQRLPNNYAERFSTRDKVKEEVLRILNCANHARHQPFYAPSKVFEQLFPNVDRVLSFIKSNDHKNVARVLQRIESNLILRECCKGLSQTNPDLPVFTLHDCIVTTEGNEGLVKDTITGIFSKRINLPPMIKIESW